MIKKKKKNFSRLGISFKTLANIHHLYSVEPNVKHKVVLKRNKTPLFGKSKSVHKIEFSFH